jgi:hypothetical protein
MPDYSKAKIYAIRAPGTDSVYIGSTTKALSARMANHRATYRMWKDGRLNGVCASKGLMEQDGCYIELLEDFPCDNKEQLNKREGEIIRSMPNAINKNVAGRTSSEYFQENKEVIVAKHNEWLAANKERVAEAHKNWVAANRERRNQKKRENYLKRKMASATGSPQTHSHPDQGQ